ncbi:class F sortase [Amycolatopsis sp. H20-H5]|uniref:class F sortase n=1 Tax=Amycolatopsis sp. H20-H5 TaxID=3046309 RepID=UPI002DBA3320|nr:class F sortase [Amycolatopsis sp. H20-H5]MEC3980902.1 class F sortase [Amycolatopsis sp. H20-H5]
MRGERALIGLLLLTLAACAPAPAAPQPAAVPTPPVSSGPSGPSGPLPLPPAADVRPVSLTIPALGIDQPALVPLTLGPDRQLLAPDRFEDIGWYSGGPVPGDPGPAVIAAHVDSRAGPAPFFRLKELRSGDEVRVRRSDGREVTFAVDSVQRYPKDAFPTAQVYGAAPGSALRLITCGGSFDAAKRSYRDNIVVFASTRWS